MLLREARAGLRRHTGAPRGEHYQELLAHLGEGDHADPKPFERTLGDLIDPTRPGRVMDICNAVTRKAKMDAAEWRVDRILSMVATLQNDPAPELPE